MCIFYWLYNRKIKIKKILFFVWLLLTFNSFAESNFKHLSLQGGIEIDVPRDWMPLPVPINNAINAHVEAISEKAKLGDSDNQNTQLILALVSPTPLYAQVRIELDSPSSLSRKDALTITQKDSPFFDEEFRKILSHTIPYQGFSLIEVYPTQIQRFHNDPAIIISYKRTGKKGPVIVRIIQAFTKSGTLRIILSCRESEAIIWNPVLNKIQESIRNN